jgi:hypothetical protein
LVVEVQQEETVADARELVGGLRGEVASQPRRRGLLAAEYRRDELPTQFRARVAELERR